MGFDCTTGAVDLNWAVVGADAKIKDGQWLGHFVHRHEPPACADPVEIIEKDDDKGTLIVNKPGGMAVHPTGQWRKVCAEKLQWWVGDRSIDWSIGRLVG